MSDYSEALQALKSLTTKGVTPVSVASQQVLMKLLRADTGAHAVRRITDMLAFGVPSQLSRVALITLGLGPEKDQSRRARILEAREKLSFSESTLYRYENEALVHLARTLVDDYQSADEDDRQQEVLSAEDQEISIKVLYQMVIGMQEQMEELRRSQDKANRELELLLLRALGERKYGNGRPGAGSA